MTKESQRSSLVIALGLVLLAAAGLQATESAPPARGLEHCAALAQATDRLACYDALATAAASLDHLTARELVSRACEGDAACLRQAQDYFQISPISYVLDVLISACAKLHGEATTDCYQRGLEQYPKLSDAELLRGDRTGRTAAQLRRLSTESLANCKGRDQDCLHQVATSLGGRKPQ